MTEHDLLYTLALQQVPNIGDITAKKLISHCGSAEAVLKEKKQNLLKIDGIGSVLLKDFYQTKYLILAEKEIQFINDNGIDHVFFQEKGYPEKLKHCVDGPILLFQTGNIHLKNQRIISIVGTRKITTSGIAFCEQLIETLVPYNPVIVSGFAYGTDITAHKAAMKHKLQTVACLAHGFNQIYPKTHKKYMVPVEAHGGFFTEFTSFDNFDKSNFLK